MTNRPPPPKSQGLCAEKRQGRPPRALGKNTILLPLFNNVAASLGVTCLPLD
jgi:hypothetical protein